MADEDYSFGSGEETPDGRDMREDYRLTARALVRIELESREPGVSDGDTTTLVCEIRDISVRGMSLVSRQALSVDSILTAEVSLDAHQAPLRLMVEVVWCREDGRGYLVGVRVLESDETDYLRWMESVAEAFSDS